MNGAGFVKAIEQFRFIADHMELGTTLRHNDEQRGAAESNIFERKQYFVSLESMVFSWFLGLVSLK